jgi:hypothetical protein
MKKCAFGMGHGMSHWEKQGICSLCVLFFFENRRYAEAGKEVSDIWIL